jgi:hypothetical protein
MKEKDLIEETLGKSFEDFYSEANEKSSGYYSTSASSGNSSTSASSGYYSTSASSGDSSKSASSGNYSTSASSGDSSKSASSGDSSKSASSGNYSTSASSGDSSKSASSGNSSKSASSGNYSTSASSGYSSKSASSGNSSKSASSGNYSTSASSGDSSKSASSGDYSTSASSGDYSKSASSSKYSKSASSGDYSKSASSGNYSTSASSGYSSTSASSGNYSSATCNGFFASVKGSLGNVIMAVEFNKQGKPIGGAVGIVGENGIKEDTFYIAHEGVLKEFIEVDGIESILLHRKGNVMRVLTSSFNESYIVSDGNGNYSHGSTIKEAKEDLIFKIGNVSKDDYKEMTVDNILSFEDAVRCYRVITGACQFGVKEFLARKNITKRKMSISKIIDLTKGEYQNEVFTQFFKK